MLKSTLLLISGISPFPQTSGGATRIKQTLLNLSKKYDIYFYFFISSDYKLSENEKKFLDNNSVFFKPVYTQHKSIIKSFKVGLPYHFSNYFNQEFTSELIRLQQKIDFDKIRVEFSQLLYLEEYLQRKFITEFVSHDISSISFKRRALENLSPISILVKLISFLQVYLYERGHLSNFTSVIAVSDHDAAILRARFGLKNVTVTPNAVAEISFLPIIKKGDLLNLGYIGSFSHTPNFEAVKFILNKILPDLEEQNIKYRFYLAGDNQSDFFEKLIANSPIKKHSSVVNLGRVGNLVDFYQKIDLLIAPIFSGSGTRIKILESLGYGRPVLTTAIGAEGIQIHTSLLKIITGQKEKHSSIWTKAIREFINQGAISAAELKKLKVELAKFIWETVFKDN